MKIAFYAILGILVAVGGYFGYNHFFAKPDKDDTEKDKAETKTAAPEAKTAAPEAKTAAPDENIPRFANKEAYDENIPRFANKEAYDEYMKRRPFVAAPKPQTIADFMPKPDLVGPFIRKANPLANVIANGIASGQPNVPPVRPLVFALGALAAKAETMRKGTTYDFGTLPPLGQFVPLAPKSINERGIATITPTPIVTIGSKLGKMSGGVNDRPGGAANRIDVAQMGGKNGKWHK